MDGVGNADEVGGAPGRTKQPFGHPVPGVEITFLVWAADLK